MRRKDTGQENIDRVWQIIEKVGVAMLTTRFPGGLRARPLEARPDRDAGVVWFVTDLRSGKEHEIEAEHDVGLVFVDPKDKAYLSITARAEVRHDRAKAAEIWQRTDNAWWNGPDDPNVCLLRVRPITAELWDGPASAALAAFEFAKARITGEKPNLGENRKVTVRMERTGASPRSSRKTQGQPPSATYQLIWEAARARRQITCLYGGHHHDACPHIVGYKELGEEAVFVFQFGGTSTKGLTRSGAWRCFDLDKITDVQTQAGQWFTGTSHRRMRPCIKFVDIDVNVPETLKHRRPLPFGSSKLRSPRQPDE